MAFQEVIVHSNVVPWYVAVFVIGSFFLTIYNLIYKRSFKIFLVHLFLVLIQYIFWYTHKVSVVTYQNSSSYDIVSVVVVYDKAIKLTSVSYYILFFHLFAMFSVLMARWLIQATEMTKNPEKENLLDKIKKKI